jgi:glycerol-3-phosphate dehydrogenase
VPSDKLNNRAAVLIPSLGEQRFLFVIPWCGRTVIGTTDTDYRGDLDNPVAEGAEVERVIQSAATSFPDAGISTDDVISTFAGLRPLVGEPGRPSTELSRKEEILEDPAGLISVIGGKLTTYRKMAERVVDLVVTRLAEQGEDQRLKSRGSVTARVRLAACAGSMGETFEPGLPQDTLEHLMAEYGDRYGEILEIARSNPRLKAALAEGLPHIEAEVLYAARYEMAATVEDFLARRTRIALLARDSGRAAAMRVATLMGEELGWTSAEVERAVAEYVA